MTDTQIIITILVVSLGTMLTRFLPFLLFPEDKKDPTFIVYLGKMLPQAAMGLLIVYCLKDAFSGSFYGVPELISIACISVLHLWKKNTFLSIGVGTVLYMILVQAVF